jgi:hypothetical protein
MMNKRVRFAALLPVLSLSLGPNTDPWNCQSAVRAAAQNSAPRPDADRLTALLRSDSFREADKLAASLLAGPALDAPTRALCGLAVLLGGHIGEAEAILHKVIARSPDEPDAHLGLGRIAWIRNDRDGAIAHFRRAVPSAGFYDVALRQLWRAAWDLGEVDGLFEIHRLAEERFGRGSEPLPSWLTNGFAQLRGLEGKRLFEMEGRFERLEVPLATPGRQGRIRMIGLGINGKGEYLFHIDSALPGFLTITPAVAEEMGLVPTGSATSAGVGTAAVTTRFSMLDKVELGPLVFRNVPVQVTDVRTLRGGKEGLLGTAFLKRFNVTIDVEAAVMDFYPLDRPELLAARIDKSAVAADVPLYLFDATTVEASMAGAPPALYILDSAAATHLVDGRFFEEHLKHKLDPARIVRSGIQGAGGPQHVNRVDGMEIGMGPLVLNGQTVHEFPMETLNSIGGRYLAGLLGNPVLWPYRVHMDFKAGRLILEKYREP